MATLTSAYGAMLVSAMVAVAMLAGTRSTAAVDIPVVTKTVSVELFNNLPKTLNVTVSGNDVAGSVISPPITTRIRSKQSGKVYVKVLGSGPCTAVVQNGRVTLAFFTTEFGDFEGVNDYQLVYVDSTRLSSTIAAESGTYLKVEVNAGCPTTSYFRGDSTGLNLRMAGFVGPILYKDICVPMSSKKKVDSIPQD